MTLTVSYSDRAPRVYGPYSQAITFGDLIYTSGQIPLDPVTMEVVAGGITEQGTQALANLRAVLQTAGSDLDRVVKTTVFLVDLADFAGLNEVYAAAFGDHRPARSTVGVSSLPRGVRVEIEAVAVRRLVFPGALAASS
jgi:2-iminobutanoate/2-iminopropanoate deaminase